MKELSEKCAQNSVHYPPPADPFSVTSVSSVAKQNPVNLVHRVKNSRKFVDDDTNRYTSIGGNPITHDPAGNLTRDRQNYRYEYGAACPGNLWAGENRIARIYKHPNRRISLTIRHPSW